MALIRGAFGGAQISGSYASLTFAQGPFGTYVRARTKPVNPNSSGQVAIRQAMAQASNRWTNLLTATQRAGWEAYAQETPLPNKFGDLVNKGGRQMYLRQAVPNIFGGSSPIDTPPATPGVADPVNGAITGDTTAGIAMAEPSGGVPAGTVIIVRIGNPVNQSRNFYKAPFTFVTVATDATVFPLVIKPGGELTVGQKYYVATRTLQTDGKVSEETIFSVDINA